MDEGQVAGRLRAELGRRAGEADTSPEARARVAGGLPASTRQGRWLVLAAAAAVAATVAGVAVVSPGSEPERGPRPSGPVSTAESPVPGEAGWRREYWRDVSVEVPDTWWYGGGLVRDRAGRPYACYPEPMVTPEGEKGEGQPRAVSAPGYVGRPIALTDVCGSDPGTAAGGSTSWPYLWFDAPLRPGVEDLGAGWVRETVEVNGSRVTVATDDERLRARILASAAGGEVCLSEMSGVPEPSQSESFEGVAAFTPDRLTVCAYRRTSPDGQVALAYAAELDRLAAAAYAPLVGDGTNVLRCASGGHGASEWAVLRFAGGDGDGDPAFHEVVVHLGGTVCPRVQLDPRTALPLAPELVRPWAVGGIPAVLYGPEGGKGAMLESFIGPRG